MRLRPHSADSTMLRLWPTGSSVGIAPVDYDPVVLLKPFGPRLAADALPSEDSPMAAPGRPIRVPAFAHLHENSCRGLSIGTFTEIDARLPKLSKVRFSSRPLLRPASLPN